MLYLDIIDVFEGIDVNKISASKQCDICHYSYFVNYFVTFFTCHDLLMISMSLNSIDILNIVG